MSDTYYTLSTGIAALINLIQSFITLAVGVVSIIGIWFTFKKANEPGWAAIIPFYNTYTMYKIAGKKKLFWWMLCAVIVYFVAILVLIFAIAFAVVGAGGFKASGGFSGSMLAGSIGLIVIMGVIAFACWAAAMVLNIIMYVGLVKSFGQSGAMAVGFVFIPVVFWLILGFSKKIQYIGNAENPIYNWRPVGGYEQGANQGNMGAGSPYVEGNYSDSSDNSSHLS